MADHSSKSPFSGEPFPSKPVSSKAAPLLEAGKISAPKGQGAHANPKARPNWFSRLWSPEGIRATQAQDASQLDVTYWVTSSAEKRGTPRQRTRLRGGKIADANNQFLSECVIIDRSPQGIRLRPVRPVTLPPSFRLYDDLDRKVVDVHQIWASNGEIGVVLRDTWESVQAANHPSASLGAKFYAVND